jgi:hypothetical protein
MPTPGTHAGIEKSVFRSKPRNRHATYRKHKFGISVRTREQN